jgi:hypothetical protein
MKALLSFVLAASTTALCQADDLRTYTNAKGQQIKARLVSHSAGMVTIQREDGQKFALAISSLIPADQAYIQAAAATAPVTTTPSSTASGPNDKLSAEELNTILGQPLFTEGPLWSSAPAEVAQRLTLKEESKTKTQSSYRSYTKPDYRIIGAHPYSVALYGEKGKVTSLSLVYANKGDLFGSKGGAEMHFDKETPPAEAARIVREAMDKDLNAIVQTLKGKLGEPKKERFGERGAGRMNMQRWDWRGHSILLADAVDERDQPEYVGVQIVPTAFADGGGKVARTADTIIREHAKANIERRPNGDVVISDIPMVDQGPKGYCVPATMERAMRFMGVPADMYILANAGDSGFGGGTSVEVLLDNVGKLIRAKSRSFDSWQGEIKLKEIARSIDKGIPIIWALYSGDDFNERANKRKESRTSISDWPAWKTTIDAEATASPFTPDHDSAHVVLIIGYNPVTNELAFSDSWGERYKERWMSLPELQQVSQGRFYTVGF